MLDSRRFVIIGFFIFVGLIFLIRLFYLQVLDESYSIVSSSNSIKRVIEIPFRGQIYDRNGKLIVYNTPVYDLMVTPYKVRIEDTLRFCSILGIERPEFDSLLNAASSYSRVKPSLFLRQLSKEDFASIQDAMVNYKGFEFTTSSLRTYTAPTLANTLGYVSEITKGQLEKQEVKYYRQSDYIGQSGVEQVYENELRGKRGIKFVMQNVNGVYKGSWKDGELDTMAVAGENLYSGIDLDLQQYGDSLMANKVGSVVAIEPKTGQIISMISAPTYDPNLLASRYFSKNYISLVRNPFKPLFNRPVMASYRPGSTFKLIQALVGLQEGVITPGSGFTHANCPVGCHGHPATSTVALGVTHSCNPYFYNVFRRYLYNNQHTNTFKASAVGLQHWAEQVSKFGIGQQLGIDLPSERKGNLPDKAYYDKRYGENGWKFSNIYSVSIGEGEILITPLKMANVAAIIANRGYYYVPHVIAGVGERKKLDPKYTTRQETGVDPRHFGPVIEGMIGAVEVGTAKRSYVPGLTIAGKTGTSQNKVGDDHSIYIAFAPVENPQIAIAVFVEYAGSGGAAAAPIANLMIEKYLKGTVTNKANEARMMQLNLMHKVILPKGAKPTSPVKQDSSKNKKVTPVKSDTVRNNNTISVNQTVLTRQ